MLINQIQILTSLTVLANLCTSHTKSAAPQVQKKNTVQSSQGDQICVTLSHKISFKSHPFEYVTLPHKINLKSHPFEYVTLSHKISLKLYFEYFDLCIILKTADTADPADYFGLNEDLATGV